MLVLNISMKEEICNNFVSIKNLVYSLEGLNYVQITELVDYVNNLYFF